MTHPHVPQVSVVIGVRNGEQWLPSTLRSVCEQQGVEFECVVVDDGSTDGTVGQIETLAQHDKRIRLIRQRRAGLTRALITGCAEARASLIARIDVGDQMLAGRLARQCEVLDANSNITVLGTLMRECGPDGQVFERVVQQMGVISDLSADYRSNDATRLAGLAHVSVCFRKRAYRQCGGYRLSFALAQDVDLWGANGCQWRTCAPGRGPEPVTYCKRWAQHAAPSNAGDLARNRCPVSVSTRCWQKR